MKPSRRAIVFEIGGFRPPEDPKASWFGKVLVGGYGELWPGWKDKPMKALAQINLQELPFRPPRLDDLAFLTLFIAEDESWGKKNGEGWVLRAYKDLGALIPLKAPESKPPPKPFPMRARVLEGEREAAQGFKLGGRPFLVQGELDWPDGAEYVFQVDSSEKGQWSWGDGGVGYFGRGGRPKDWVLEWQSL